MTRIMRLGQSGEDVRRLQGMLAAAGFDPGPVDGIFGPATDRAVRRFQQSRGLTVDGLVGPMTLAALAAASGGGSNGGGGRGLSLHIGLNRVDTSMYPEGITVLSGCVNDAKDMKAIAEQHGYVASTLFDLEATAEAVLSRIRIAADQLRDGDIFLLTYSGHGSQFNDPTGDEVDGLDETWVLADRQVIDDELAASWTRFRRGVRILVMSDSCHSGTVARGFGSLLSIVGDVLPHLGGLPQYWLNSVLGAPKSVGPDPLTAVITRTIEKHAPPSLRSALANGNGSRGRSLPPAVAQADADARRELYRSVKQAARSAVSKAVGGPSVLLISGCQDNQESLDGVQNGLFTQQLLSVWRSGAVTTYADLHRRILRTMPPSQSPNFYWASDRNEAFENQRPFTVSAP